MTLDDFVDLKNKYLAKCHDCSNAWSTVERLKDSNYDLNLSVILTDDCVEEDLLLKFCVQSPEKYKNFETNLRDSFIRLFEGFFEDNKKAQNEAKKKYKEACEKTGIEFEASDWEVV